MDPLRLVTKHFAIQFSLQDFREKNFSWHPCEEILKFEKLEKKKGEVMDEQSEEQREYLPGALACS